MGPKINTAPHSTESPRPKRPATPKQEAARRANWRYALVIGSPLGRFQSSGRPDDDEDLELIAMAIGRIRGRWFERRQRSAGVRDA